MTNFLLSVAHFAPIPGKQIDNLINDKDVLKTDNTIILQVSATPYNLVTKNTRLVSKAGLRIRINGEKWVNLTIIGFWTETTMTCTKANVSWRMTGINIMVGVWKKLNQQIINFFSGVGEFVDATERMEQVKKEPNNPKSSLQPGTFTDDRCTFN